MGTTNKNLELPAYNSTNWNTPLNSNFQIIDNTFGNSTTVNVGSTDQILTYADIQAMRLYITGNIAANNRVVTIPSGVGGSWVVTNAVTYTTGTVTLKSAFGGSGLVLTPGGSAVVYSDGTEVYSATSGATGSYLPLTGGTLSGPLTLQSTLGVSGITTFASNVNFNGGMTLPFGQTFTVNGSLALGSSALNAASLALGGASIGANALAVTGSSSLNGNVTLPGGNVVLTTGNITVSNSGAVSSFGGLLTAQNLNVTGTLSATTFNPTNITLAGQLVVNGTGANTLTGTTTIPTGSKIVFQANSTMDMSASPTTLSLGNNPVTTTGTVTGGTVNSNGNINATAGTITGGTVTSNGALNGASLNVGSGTITSGQVSASSFTTTGAVNANAVSYFNNGVYINSTGSQQNTFKLTGASTSVNMAYGGSDKFSFNSNGIAYATSSWSVSSDERLKTDIGTIQNALTFVKNMRGVSFKWKDSGQSAIGVVAQEMQTVMPQTVSEGPNGYLGVSYGNLVGVLIEAIKELEFRVAELEAK